jgi:hypothetical protein
MATRTLSSPKLITVSEQIYALLLVLYPSRFRDEYGHHMALAFRDLCRSTYYQQGVSALAWLWLSTLIDLGATAFSEQLTAHGGPGKVGYKLGVGLAAGMVGGLVAGLGARLAMRGVSLAGGLTPSFTLEGTFAIMAIGLTMGVPFGLAFMLLRSFLPGEGLWKGLIFGTLLFVIFIAPPFLFYREGEALLATPWVTVALFAPVTLSYGLVVQFTAQRLEHQPTINQQSAASTSIWSQIVWLIIFACLLELAVLGILSIVNHLPRIPIGIVRQLQTAHIPFAIARDLNALLITLIAITYFGLATLIFWSRNRSLMARFTAITLLLFGGAVFNTGANYYASLTHDTALVEIIFRLLQVVASTCLLALLYGFPNGRFVFRWTQVLFAIWLAWAIAWVISSIILPEAVTITIAGLFFISGIAAQMQRYRYLATPEQRQQSRSIVVGFVVAVIGFAIVAVALLILPDLRIAKVTGLSITATFSLYLLPWLLVPLTIGWSMLRHKLWAL